MMVDIIIPQYNNCEYTINLLKSIKDCTRDYRIILIDNGSDIAEFNSTIKELKTHDSYFVIQNPENLGFIKGVNQGIASSTAEYVILQNNDTIVEPGWVDKMLECFDDPAVGLVVPFAVRGILEVSAVTSRSARMAICRVVGRRVFDGAVVASTSRGTSGRP